MEASPSAAEETTVLRAEIDALRERLRRAERAHEARLRELAHRNRHARGIPVMEPGPHRRALEAELERDRAVAERDSAVAERDRLRADLTTVYGSYSWRVGRRIVNAARTVAEVTPGRGRAAAKE
jgi:hypothetical protein